MSDLEKLRGKFRPRRITTLFVGESPPHNGTFFYQEDSRLYHRMRECFGAVTNFLPEFMAKGFFLDDLVLSPINQIKDEHERNRLRQEGVLSLARRMAACQPLAVVSLMCAIKPMVGEAMREAGLLETPLYVTPFPGRPKQQEQFRARMAEIIPKLPVALIGDDNDLMIDFKDVSHSEPRPTHSEDGVDLTVIRWMLSLTPAERLQVLQQTIRSIMKMRGETGD
jgi:hypothetical protein